MPPLVIPIFITHQGCPHRCIFCNQEPITGIEQQSTSAITDYDVKIEIEKCLARSPRMNREVQVAFYGGSFTGLPITKQEMLLGAVQPYIQQGQVDGIRLSTRPDYIDQNTASFLKNFGVSIVEIGIQSMDPAVLEASLRGHTVEQSIKAIGHIKGSGINTGAQLMIGLPAETTAKALKGAQQLAGLQPDFVRLYPAIIIKGSGLYTLYKNKKYLPISLNRAIALTARIKDIMDQNSIMVVRTGLQPSEDLEKSFAAGPHHPALGELVQARLKFNQLRARLSILPAGKKKIIINEKDRSIFYGQKKCSLKRLEKLGLLEQAEMIFDHGQKRGTFMVQMT